MHAQKFTICLTEPCDPFRVILFSNILYFNKCTIGTDSAQDPLNFDANYFKQDRVVKLFFFFFLLIFMLKLDEPFRDHEIFKIFVYSIVQIRVLIVKFYSFSFRLIFSPLDPYPWIRILSTDYSCNIKFGAII